jgi:hypothetical protein
MENVLFAIYNFSIAFKKFPDIAGIKNRKMMQDQ